MEFSVSPHLRTYRRIRTAVHWHTANYAFCNCLLFGSAQSSCHSNVCRYDTICGWSTPPTMVSSRRRHFHKTRTTLIPIFPDMLLVHKKGLLSAARLYHHRTANPSLELFIALPHKDDLSARRDLTRLSSFFCGALPPILWHHPAVLDTLEKQRSSKTNKSLCICTKASLLDARCARNESWVCFEWDI